MSGCVNIDLNDLFKTSAVNVHQQTIHQGLADVLTINNIVTIPHSPIIPGSDVLLSFVLENKDTLKKARDVRVDLFDAPTFKNKNNELCNVVGCFPDGEECGINKPCTILPGEQKPIKFYLKAPTQEEIVSIKTSPKLNFKVLYTFDSELNYLFPVITLDEIIKQQQAGQSPDLKITKSYSSGPIQIDVEMLGQNYVLATEPAIFNFKIRNIGNGNLENSVIEPEHLTIIFPLEFTLLEYPTELFNCGHNICVNTKNIDVYKDESRMSLRFKVLLSNPQIANPFKTFEIKANVLYTYELRQSLDITIKPFQIYG